MKRHIWEETTVGIAQGIRTTARSSPRPRKTSFITSAMPRPMPSSSGMVVTTKNRVVRKDWAATGSVAETGRRDDANFSWRRRLAHEIQHAVHIPGGKGGTLVDICVRQRQHR